MADPRFSKAFNAAQRAYDNATPEDDCCPHCGEEECLGDCGPDNDDFDIPDDDDRDEAAEWGGVENGY